MITRIKSKNIIVDKSFFDGNIYFEDGKITAVTKEELPCDKAYDFGSSYVSAGFIEMHTHGAGGHAFTMSSPEEVALGADFHLQNGMTTIVPTISAGPFDVMREAVRNIDIAKNKKLSKARILGAHMEGPYLSPKQAGAQCPDFISDPCKEDYASLVEELGDSITRWSYAPENDKNGEFCNYITKHNILASAGHTDAKYPDIALAMDNGCKLVTHLYSATSTITREYGFRSLGVIESAFLRDDMYVEIIADGKHLPLDLIRMIIKIKGIDKVALITDSLEIAGTDVKEGVMSGTRFIVEDGVCKLCDRSAFAGSVATANMLIRTIKECGYTIPEAVYMYTAVPAEILGLNAGRIREGADADIIVFDEDINVKNVFVLGDMVVNK